MRVIISLLLLSITQLAMAKTSFEQHLHSVSQAMSALYMYELSEGDTQHLVDFKRYRDVADRALIKSELVEKKLFLKRWQSLKPYWRIESDGKNGFGIDFVVREDAREYLTEVYLRAQTISAPNNTVAGKYKSIQIITSMLSARALDLLAEYNGSSLLTEHDRQIDEKKLSNQVHNYIKQLLSSDLTQEQRKKLNKVKARFEFVDRNLTHYDQVMPYFLVYKSVLSIGKLLGESSQTFAEN